MNVNSVSGKNWKFKEFDYNDLKELSEKHSLSEIVSKLVAIRKNNISDINLYLNPTIKNLLPNPYNIKDMKKAVERTYKSIKKSETIGIFGDYDVDGASSTALLSRYFISLNKKIITYIPDRKNEGSGPSIKGFNSLSLNFATILYGISDTSNTKNAE